MRILFVFSIFWVVGLGHAAVGLPPSSGPLSPWSPDSCLSAHRALSGASHHSVPAVTLSTPSPGVAQTPREVVDNVLATNDPQGTFAAVRKALLDRHEVISHAEGGLGFTFLLKETSTGKLVRYKVPKNPADQATFEREAKLGELAHGAGVGPKVKFDRALGLMEMENIVGMDFHQFQYTVLSQMPPRDREQFITNFMNTLTSHLQKLHEAGVVHFDLKPANIMIPTDHRNGTNIKIIDFGLGLKTAELNYVTQMLAGMPHPGTATYQGRSALRGKPVPGDDFGSVRLIYEWLLPPSHYSDLNTEVGRTDTTGHEVAVPRPLAQRREMPIYFQRRPLLRALLLLIDHPAAKQVSPVTGSASIDKLMAIATKENPTPEERAYFWENFLTQLSDRSPGQKLQILFGDPVLHAKNGGLLRTKIKDPELKKIIEEGLAENEPYYDLSQRYNLGRSQDPVAEANEMHTAVGLGRHDIDTLRLAEVQRELGIATPARPQPMTPAPAVAHRPPSSTPGSSPGAQPTSPTLVERRAPPPQGEYRRWLTKALAAAALGLAFAAPSDDDRREKGPPQGAPLGPTPKFASKPPLRPGDNVDGKQEPGQPALHDVKPLAQKPPPTPERAPLPRPAPSAQEAAVVAHLMHQLGSLVDLNGAYHQSAALLREAQSQMDRGVRFAVNELQRLAEAAKEREAERRRNLERQEQEKKKRAELEKKQACRCRGEWSETANFSSSRLCVIRDGEGQPLAWHPQPVDDPYCWTRCSPKTDLINPIIRHQNVKAACTSVAMDEPLDWRWGPGAGYEGRYFRRR